MKVRYNGGTDSLIECTSPVGVLVPGRVYEESGAIELANGLQKNIYLKEVCGLFNASWFEVVKG